ncbi:MULTISPECIES: flagellar hook assembly protein FlgD [Halobacillus]|uniref:flagellar hook assembly protein FlgD n=1 Tax=Halobacillus TaxID=45667 RepID=UPI000413652F|nr:MULTISPECIES: flagellar hook assembly protein FlgD [Halobacillus]
MTSIDPSFYLKNQQPHTSGSNILEKDDFLKILMTQIQNQNPLDPMKDQEFVSQMTQFSSLEQMTNMSTAFQSFTEQQNMSSLITYSHLIGKEVTYSSKDQGGLKTDVVAAVNQKEDGTYVELQSGSLVSVQDLTKVSQESGSGKQET